MEKWSTGITDGIPHYINKLAVANDVDEALKENLINTSSYLFNGAWRPGKHLRVFYEECL